MPNLNQKGPMGEGPMTGRKMGRCTNYGVGRNKQTIQENENRENLPNDDIPTQGLGRGRGRGLGRGMKNGLGQGGGMGQSRGGRGMRRSGGGRGMGMGRRFRDDSQE